MNKLLTIETNKQKLLVPLNDVLYIRTNEKSHQLSIVTYKESYTIYQTLSRLEQEFEDLVLCSRGTLVNLKAIKGIDKEKKRFFSGKMNRRTVLFQEGNIENC